MADYNFKDKDDVKKYLIDDWAKTDFAPTTLDLPEGVFVISPYFGYDVEHNINNIEWINVDGVVPWLSNDSLDKVSESIANIDTYIAEYENDKRELFSFYNETIAGHTGKELALGNAIAYDVDRRDVNPSNPSDVYFENFIKHIAAVYSVSENEAREAYDLADDYGVYSDWHKDIYQFRPRGDRPGVYVSPYDSSLEDIVFKSVDENGVVLDDINHNSNNMWSNEWEDPKYDMREYDYSDEIEDEIMYYYTDKYRADDSTYIGVMVYDWDDDFWEPYDDISVNLSGYGLTPENENRIYLPLYKMSEDLQLKVRRDLVKEVLRPVEIGYGSGVEVELRDDWKDFIDKSKISAFDRVASWKDNETNLNKSKDWIVFDNISNKNISDIKTDKFGKNYQFVRLFDEGKSVSMIVPSGYIKSQNNGRSTVVVPGDVDKLPFKGKDDSSFEKKSVIEIYNDIYVPQQKSVEDFNKSNQNQNEIDNASKEVDVDLGME